MRLIDGDELWMDIIHSMDYCDDLLEIIERQPTIEPERKRGEWYKPTGMMPPEYAGAYRCSECDELAMRDWKTHKQTLTNFCPNCGADMRCSENPNS